MTVLRDSPVSVVDGQLLCLVYKQMYDVQLAY
jgi:hypothetical protein